MYVWKGFNEVIKVAFNGGYLGLLEHHFRKPNMVNIWRRRLPRKIFSSMALKPN
jgi:hypothetical protein